MQKERIVGILGGMGPEATVDLMDRIIRVTRESGNSANSAQARGAGNGMMDDADHIRCIVDNNPKVPSRIKALIEGGGENPGPVMADMARRLEAYGADFLCIACNTAHNYFSHVREAVKIPVLNIIELTAEAALKAGAPSREVGILASPAVRTTRLYTDALERLKARAVYPDDTAEAALLELIRAIKAGHTGEEARRELARVAANLKAKGVGVIAVACTELGVIMPGQDFGLPVVDAAEVLAAAVVREAKGAE